MNHNDVDADTPIADSRVVQTPLYALLDWPEELDFWLLTANTALQRLIMIVVETYRARCMS